MTDNYICSSTLSPLTEQKGVALLTVLFLFALATVIMSGLVALLQTDIQRASSVLESEQAYMLTLSGEEWARQLLADDYKINTDIDHVHEKWAENGKIMEVDNGYIELSIRDAQGMFNINNLSASKAGEPMALVFQRLINFALQDQQLSSTITNQAIDWMDADKNGTEEIDYLSEVIPYRPPNSMITDISELRWLKDMNPKVYKALHKDVFPSLIALPNQTTVNINTASAPVIAAFSNLSVPDAENVVVQIQSNINGVASVSSVPQVAALAQNFGVYSEYFEVRVRAKFSDHYAFLTSIIYRDHQNQGKMIIISRDRSERFIFPFSKDYNGNGNSKDYEIDI